MQNWIGFVKFSQHYSWSLQKSPVSVVYPSIPFSSHSLYFLSRFLSYERRRRGGIVSNRRGVGEAELS